jgi:hypothetical protein
LIKVKFSPVKFSVIITGVEPVTTAKAICPYEKLEQSKTGSDGFEVVLINNV